MYRYIGFFLGFIFTGFNFFGAFFGYFVGYLIDKHSKSLSKSSNIDIERQFTAQDFTIMLLVLSASVMKADGKVMKSELDFVKDFLKEI